MTTTVIPQPGAEPERLRTPVPLLQPQVPREPPAVEKVLAKDLIKAPMQEARRLADQLGDAQEIANLLDQWSREGAFRRKLLGRQARIQRAQTDNVYFYTLRVLLETREPERVTEEPDYKAAPIPLERELERWSVALPPPKGFVDEPGAMVRVPGSMRVISCDGCKGVGRITCPRCQGRQRIVVQRPQPAAGGRPAQQPAPAGAGAAAGTQVEAGTTMLIPCPDCEGSGGLRCKQCDGVSRLVQHKTVQWRRRATQLETNDDLPRVDEQWLQRTCKSREVYKERQKSGFRPEWSQVPEIAELVKTAERQLDANTRVAQSELVIRFIPVTEIVFDLGQTRPAPAAPAKAKAKGLLRPADTGVYRWHIYGFEKQLPKDWRFLNWDRVTSVSLLALAIALVALLVLVGIR